MLTLYLLYRIYIHAPIMSSLTTPHLKQPLGGAVHQLIPAELRAKNLFFSPGNSESTSVLLLSHQSWERFWMLCKTERDWGRVGVKSGGVGGEGGPPDTSEPPAALSDPAPLAWSLPRLPAGHRHHLHPALPLAILPPGWETAARSRTRARIPRRDWGADWVLRQG